MVEKITQLLEALKSPDTTVKKYAIEDLGELKDEKAVEPLISLLNDEEVAVQEAAAESLIKIGGISTVGRI